MSHVQNLGRTNRIPSCYRFREDIYVNEYFGKIINVRIFLSFVKAYQIAFAVENALNSQVNKSTHLGFRCFLLNTSVLAQ